MFFYKNGSGLYSTEVEMYAENISVITEEEYNHRLEEVKKRRISGEPIDNTEDW